MHKWEIGFLIKEVSILSIIKVRFLTAREGRYKFGKEKMRITLWFLFNHEH